MPEEEQKFQKRQIAHKVRIGDILNSRYVKTEGLIPNYLEVNSQEVSRVNIIGVVVEKSEINSYKTLAVDDGTGKISARIFENNIHLENIGVSDIVLVIGKPREFSSEKYILIETIKKIDPAWAKARKIELEKSKPQDDAPAQEGANISSGSGLAEEEIINSDSTPANNVIKLIRGLDKGDGVAIDNIPSKGINDLDKTIDMLLKGGSIFEVRPGKLKVLE